MTDLVRKLGIKSGHEVALLSAPPGWRIEDLPDGVRPSTRARGTFDVIVAFCARRAQLERRLPALIGVLRTDGGLWVAWPRKVAGHESDISENLLREIILPTGLVDIKVAALDDDWSGLKFVRRGQRVGVRPAHRARANTVAQSFLMLTIVQPFLAARSSACSAPLV